MKMKIIKNLGLSAVGKIASASEVALENSIISYAIFFEDHSNLQTNPVWSITLTKKRIKNTPTPGHKERTVGICSPF
jgi:hypothetical protein